MTAESAIHPPASRSRGAFPRDLRAFAESVRGDFEQRFARLVEYAFKEHALMLNAAQLRKLCAGGSQETAQRAIDKFRQQLHHYVVRRLSASAIAEWIEQGMPAQMTSLSEKEKLIARTFLRYLATIKPSHPS